MSQIDHRPLSKRNARAALVWMAVAALALWAMQTRGTGDQGGHIDGCVAPSDLDAPPALAGLPVQDAMEGAVQPGYQLGELRAIEVESPEFETPWYAVAANVRSADEREVGTAIWLLPDPVVTYSGSSEPAALSAWQAAPWKDPTVSRIYAANDLAVASAVWDALEGVEIPDGQVERAKACVSGA